MEGKLIPDFEDLEDFLESSLDTAEVNAEVPENAFCPTSLRDWMEACEKANVPAIPAYHVVDLLREDCLRFDVEGDHHERLASAFETITKSMLPNHMLRFDCCTSMEVKYHLSKGRHEWREEFNFLMLDDIRAFDIIFEFPRKSIPVWRRPWIKPSVIEGYPVEYRVFVKDQTIQGISSYYPQRPLPEFPHHLDSVRSYTEKLMDVLAPPFLWHRNSDVLDLNAIHFTADFLVTADDEVMFLEGGPPHELDAHPCCFEPGKIEGIALVNRNE